MKASDPLLCPRNHAVRRNAALLAGYDAIRCDHRPYSGHGRCGRYLYVLIQPDGTWWTAEITPRELLFMQEQKMTPIQVKAYLLLNSPETARRAA